MSPSDATHIWAATFSRGIFCVCCTIIMCRWFSSCELDNSVIESCQDSCKGYGSHMESVTTRECVCTTPQSIEIIKDDIWVLPKK